MSKLYRISFVQNIPSDIDTIWDFISSPANLKKITPPHMGFKILSEIDSDKMYTGQIIEYTVYPFPLIPMGWVTEIKHVKDKEYFVDEQRFGPYALWHHKHFIKPISNGVEMRDIVDYKIPFGFIGDIANIILVKKQLKNIFEYRFQKIEEIFGKY
ncbi:MAG: SRPBCC family protein [Bacteroidota bacterium]|nr:SRPBCC family protein [Bacteroidota bacterium]